LTHEPSRSRIGIRADSSGMEGTVPTAYHHVNCRSRPLEFDVIENAAPILDVYQRCGITVAMDELRAALERNQTRRALPPPARRRLLREQHGISQDVVARAVGVDRATIARWELGDREPRDVHLERYAEVLRRLSST